MNTLRTGKYLHYKGNPYEVIGVAKHTETMEELVVYKTLYEGRSPKGSLFVRPLKMFTETVTHEGKQVPRFQYIS